MIWYILYPFRGTTEPPKLSPSHPIRRAFQLHGAATASHWLLSILTTVAVSVLLCYPVLFLPDSSAAIGLRNLPRHVWTSTAEFEGNSSVDVEMRQVWVHGDYMKAIEHRVLKQALLVQDVLIAPGFDDAKHTELSPVSMPQQEKAACIPKSAGVSWGFHSPLMYWNCSRSILDADNSLLETINSKSGQLSFLNFTLRPSSLFAGKHFVKSRLRGADALVITLLDRTGTDLGAVWESRAARLAMALSASWTMYPVDGHVVQSRLYRFSFQPMTLYDDLMLAIVYFFLAVYVLYRLGNIRAIKSKVGLIIAICFKLSVSVIASLTVCSFLDINLTHIPREVFPFVVVLCGLGNIFRLINEVLATPPEIPPIQRISHAIGEVGHMSLAAAFQNLVVLYLLSRLVHPWVAQFCAFAAATVVFDFVFHITFFLAVLSVEVQRMELQDSLERVNTRQLATAVAQGQQSWLGAVRRGHISVGTRLIGSVGIASFILILDWHFFDSGKQQFSVRRVINMLLQSKPRATSPAPFALPPINQARTPADWLKMQDHNTAKELIEFVKPGAHSFIARVYDPIHLVLKGADGRQMTPKQETIREILQHLIHDHAFPAALIVVFTIAGVTLLMNYLLWNGSPRDTAEDNGEDIPFSVKDLPMSHSLDVVRLAACGKGHLLSVALDRSTSIWMFEQEQGYSHVAIHPANLKPKMWPIIAGAVHDGGGLFALCSQEGRVGIWSLTTRRFLFFPEVELRGQSPILFSLATSYRGDQEGVDLLLVTPDGYLTQLDTRSGRIQSRFLNCSLVTSAALLTRSKGATDLVFVSKSGELHVLSLTKRNYARQEAISDIQSHPLSDREMTGVRSVFVVSSLRLIFAVRTLEVDVLDSQTGAHIHTLRVQDLKPTSFRVIHSARRWCTCGAPAVQYICVAYTAASSTQMIMHRYTLDDRASAEICLGQTQKHQQQHNCRGLDSAKDTTTCVDPVGAWEITQAQFILGIRKVAALKTTSSSASGVDTHHFTYQTSFSDPIVKSRARDANTNLATPFSGLRKSPGTMEQTDSGQWEAWSLSLSGEFRTRPLLADPEEEAGTQLDKADEQLFVASPGPITRLGQRSAAVGFGNIIKIITLGKESFGGSGSDEFRDPSVAAYKWRTRRGTARKMQ